MGLLFLYTFYIYSEVLACTFGLFGFLSSLLFTFFSFFVPSILGLVLPSSFSFLFPFSFHILFVFRSSFLPFSFLFFFLFFLTLLRTLQVGFHDFVILEGYDLMCDDEQRISLRDNYPEYSDSANMPENNHVAVVAPSGGSKMS